MLNNIISKKKDVKPANMMKGNEKRSKKRIKTLLTQFFSFYKLMFRSFYIFFVFEENSKLNNFPLAKRNIIQESIILLLTLPLCLNGIYVFFICHIKPAPFSFDEAFKKITKTVNKT